MLSSFKSFFINQINSFTSKYFHIINDFALKGNFSNSDEYRKSLSIIAFIILGEMVMLAYFLLYLFLGMWLSAMGNLLAQSILMLSLFLYPKLRNWRHLVYAHIIASYIPIIVITLETGGFHSPAKFWVIIPPLLASLFLSTKQSLGWFFFSGFFLIGILLLDISDLQIHTLSSTRDIFIHNLTSALGLFFFTLIVIMIFSIERKDFISLLTDIKERLTLHSTELEKSEARYRAIIEGQKDIIYRSNFQRNITFANEVMCSFLGMSMEKILGNKCWEFAFLQDQIVIKNALDQLEQGRHSIEIEHRMTNYEGKNRWFSSSIIAISTQHKGILEFQTVSRDITARKILESDLLKANHSKDRFFSIIAHDLKNPFLVLVTLSKLLLNKFDKLEVSAQKSFILDIHEASEKTYRLLQNLLDWARSQTGGLQYEPQVFYLGHITSEQVSLLAKQAEAKKISLDSHVNPSYIVFADINMIKTVIRNLLSNAIKFTSQNGSIIIQTQRLEHGMIELSIKDSGTGISPDLLPHIFEMGQKGSTLGSEGEHGTGLGLILCQEMIKLNGGAIEATNNPDRGSTFRFTIPANLQTISTSQSFGTEHYYAFYDHDSFAIQQQLLSDNFSKIPKLSILLADDLEINRKILKLLFESQKHTIDTANDGMEVCKKFHLNNYDLILMDLEMPLMTGIEASSEIRASRKYKENPIPIVGISAYDQSELDDQSKAPFDAMLTKPLQYSDFVETLSKLL